MQPEITTRADAQEEADRQNQYCQAVIGVKEGLTEAFISAVGTDVTDVVLRDADGSSNKGIDEYKISDLTDAIISGANRPKAPDVLKQLIEAINMPFDFRKKVSTNVELLKANAAKVQSYGIKIDPAIQVLTIFANMDKAVQHEWGREFRPALQTLRTKYPYNYKHTDASMATILNELATADSVRDLKEAPEPETGAAMAVEEQLQLLQQMMQEGDNDYEESAFAAQSDSDTSTETKKKKKSRKTEYRGRSIS